MSMCASGRAIALHHKYSVKSRREGGKTEALISLQCKKCLQRPYGVREPKSAIRGLPCLLGSIQPCTSFGQEQPVGSVGLATNPEVNSRKQWPRPVSLLFLWSSIREEFSWLPYKLPRGWDVLDRENAWHRSGKEDEHTSKTKKASRTK